MTVQEIINVLNTIKEKHGPDHEIRFRVVDDSSQDHLASAEWDTSSAFWRGITTHENKITLYIGLEENHEGNKPKIIFRKEN